MKLFHCKTWFFNFAFVLSTFAPFNNLALAQESEVETLKRQLGEMQRQMQQLSRRLENIEREKAADSAKVERVEQSLRTARATPSSLNPAIGLVIDATGEHREADGGNFNLRAAELGLSASVDPFARAYAFITGSESEVELEEAAVVTTSLPWNLTARGGKFFADFGRLPKFHQHELPFVNFPLSIERMVGGESVGIGGELNYLFPTPFFLRLTAGGYNKIGEENERLENGKSRSWSRFTYLGRLHSYFDLTDDHSLELGSTLAYTPSVRVASDPSGSDRTLSGIDLTYRYQPLAQALYRGLTLGGEFYSNSERVERPEDRFARRIAYGGYGYAEAKLTREWSAGFLFDHAPSIESPGKKTRSYSPFLTWKLSEFNRLRFQYSYFDDKVREERAERGHQFFLQWTTALGSHTHGFRTR